MLTAVAVFAVWGIIAIPLMIHLKGARDAARAHLTMVQEAEAKTREFQIGRIIELEMKLAKRAGQE